MAHVAGWGVVADVRQHIYEHLQRLSLRFYEDKQTGQLMSRVVNDSDLFEQLIAHAVPDVVVNVLTLIGVSAVLFRLNWQLTLLSLVPIPLVVLSLQVYARYVRPAFRERQKELGELNATLNDNLSGIREIKAFTREETDEAAPHRHRASTATARSLLRALRLMATFQPFVEFTSSLGQHRRHLFWRAAGVSSKRLAGGRPGGLFSLPGDVLSARAQSERRVGASSERAGGRRSSGRAAGRRAGNSSTRPTRSRWQAGRAGEHLVSAM